MHSNVNVVHSAMAFNPNSPPCLLLSKKKGKFTHFLFGLSQSGNIGSVLKVCLHTHYRLSHHALELCLPMRASVVHFLWNLFPPSAPWPPHHHHLTHKKEMYAKWLEQLCHHWEPRRGSGQGLHKVSRVGIMLAFWSLRQPHRLDTQILAVKCEKWSQMTDCKPSFTRSAVTHTLHPWSFPDISQKNWICEHNSMNLLTCMCTNAKSVWAQNEKRENPGEFSLKWLVDEAE